MLPKTRPHLPPKKRARAPPWLSKLCPTKHPSPNTSSCQRTTSTPTFLFPSLLTRLLYGHQRRSLPVQRYLTIVAIECKLPLGFPKLYCPPERGVTNAHEWPIATQAPTHGRRLVPLAPRVEAQRLLITTLPLTSCFRPLSPHPFSWRATHSGAVSSNMHHTDEMEHSSVTSTSKIAMSLRRDHDSSERKLGSKKRNTPREQHLIKDFRT